MRRSSFLFAAAAFVGTVAACLMAVTQPFVRPIASQASAVDPQRLETHVRHLSVDLFPRSHDQPVQLERAAQYILAEFRAAGGTVTVQEVAVQGDKYKNIVARFGPATGPLLVIGAHYDSHGDAPGGAKDPRGPTPDTHTPGADDNASGVAGLLELARLPVYSINAPPLLQGIDFSDHLSYWREGIPALMITDTAFMRNHHYHQASDTYEKLDYRRMAMVVQGVHAVTQAR